MRSRHGTSLVECVVAITLFTVGAMGATATVLVAQRADTFAWQRVMAARILDGRIDAFHRGHCRFRDSTWTRHAGGEVHEQWRLSVADSMAHLTGSVGVGHPPRVARIPIAVRRRCP
jgi:hypothetical protein